jgi:uncharacterized protein
MNPYAAFLNQAGRLRSGWRAGIFVLAFGVLLFLLTWLVRALFVVAQPSHLTANQLFENLVFRLVLLASALVAGWFCCRWLEGLPWRSLGLTFHSGWWWDLSVGTVVGAMSLALAAGIALVGGGLRFSFSGSLFLSVTLQSLASTALLFIVGALAEEAMFRGFPLQTFTRAGLAWLAILLTSVPFALVHLQNPNVVAGFTFINTALAGVWLALAYLRTRSLWFPLGVHWAWNWFLGSVFGLPVSGLKLSDHPLLTAFDRGPAWLTGGSYGIEGGLACTIALLGSMFFIWRTKLVSATPEMLKLTSEENPVKSDTL